MPKNIPKIIPLLVTLVISALISVGNGPCFAQSVTVQSFKVPLDVIYGGTGQTSLDDLKTSLGLSTTDIPTFAGLTLTGFSGFLKATAGVLFAGSLADSDIPDTITLTNITQITNRSHTSLTDIGTLSHSTIDSYLDQSVQTGASPTFVTVKLAGLADGYIPYHSSDSVGLVNSPIYSDGTSIGIGTSSPSSKLHIYSTTSLGAGLTLGNSTPYLLMYYGASSEGFTIGTVSTAGLINNYTVVGDSVMRYLGGKFHIARNVSGVPTMTLTQASFVGINNISPDAALQIGDSVSAGTNLYLHIEGAAADLWFGQSSGTLFGYTAGTAGFIMQGIATPLVIGNYANEKLQFATNNVVRMTILNDGNVGIGTSSPSYPLHVSGNAYLTGYVGIGSAPNTSYKLYVAQTATDATLDGIRVLVGKSVTTNGSYYDYAVNALLNISIGSGITDSGSATSFKTDALRNVSGDAGTLSYLQGTVIQYGHGSSIETSATTTSARGLAITRYAAKGTITNAYDIYIGAPITGGTVTNSWSIYSANTASNYLAGNLGIGVVPTAPLHIVKTQDAATYLILSNYSTGTGAMSAFQTFNEDVSTAYTRFMTMGTGYTTAGGYIQDSGVMEAGSGISNGLSIIARATNAGVRIYVGGYTDAHERFRITSTGNIGFNTTSFGTSAAKVLAIGSGTDPTTVITDGVQLWSADMEGTAGAAGLHMMSEDSTDVQIVAGIIVKSTTGDPTVLGPKFCINTYDNTFKVYAESGWRSLATW